MSVFSKLIRKSCRNWTCYELGHTWSPSCTDAWIEIGICAFKEGFKIYLPLYVVAALVRGKGFRYYWRYLLPEALRSATFLGTNGLLFLSAFCVWRWLLNDQYFLTMFASAYVGSLGAITLERKFRRGLLAVYMANIAAETMYLMLKARGIVQPLPYGEVWLFSGAAATLMYLFRTNALRGSTHSALRYLADGPLAPKQSSSPSSSERTSVTSLRTSSMRNNLYYSKFINWFRQYLIRLRKLVINQLCRHQNGCVYHMIEGGVRSFTVGYMIQIVLRLFRLIRLLPRKPGVFLKSLFLHRGSLNFGCFLSSLVLILRGVRCGLRYFLKKDSTWQSVLAGFLAGWSMIFFRSSSIAMYVTSKTLELLYMRGIDAGILPSIKNGDILLYAFAVGFVFHACTFEPHNVRPAYYSFLERICGGRFQELNRRLLDEFGTQASKLRPDFWPKYDARFTKLAEGPHMIEEMIKQSRVSII